MRYLLLAVTICGFGLLAQQAIVSAAPEPNACGGSEQLANEPGGECEVDRGYCTRAGTYRCVAKDATACITGADFREVCDGLDNDCNGQVDDRVACCGTRACSQSNPAPRKWDPESRPTDNQTF